MEALTDKQEMFCREYIVDLNATQAAIRAGYSEATAASIGHENLTKLDIASRVRELMAARAERLRIDGDWVLGRLIDICDKCMEAKPVMVFSPADRCMVHKENSEGELLYEFDAAGANKATELIGKHLGFFEKNNSQKKGKVTLKIGGRSDA